MKPVNPSIATTSTQSRQDVSRSPSQVLNTCFDRPSTISSSRAGPVPSRIGVSELPGGRSLWRLPQSRVVAAGVDAFVVEVVDVLDGPVGGEPDAVVSSAGSG